MANKYYPVIGDVVILRKKPHVLVKVDDRENMASCTYDRTYYFVPEDEFGTGGIPQATILDKATKFEITGTEFPNFKKADSEGYDITEIPFFYIKKL